MHRRRRQQSNVFAPLPRVLDLSQQQLRHPKREHEVGDGLEIRLQTPAVKNEEVLRGEYNYLFQPYETEVPREATGRAASSLGNPTITKLPRVLDSGTEAAHEVLRQAVDAAIVAQDWLEVWIITRQARVWYDSWLVKGNAAEKPWWMLQAEAASGDGVTEHVDLSQDAAPATDLTSGDGGDAAVVKRERTDGERPMTLPVPILKMMSGGCKVTRTRTDLRLATCNAELWPETRGLAKALDEERILSVVSFLDYPHCVLLLSTNRSLQKLLLSRPVRLKAAGMRAWDLVVESMKRLDKCTNEGKRYVADILTESTKEELARIVEEFPGALEERHLPPYATSTARYPRGYWGHHYSRLFNEPRPGKPRPGRHWKEKEPELYSGSEGGGWHGVLPDSPITPLELAVSWPGFSEGFLDFLQGLIDLGSKVTELALDITTSNYDDDWNGPGCWIEFLLDAAPHLVSTTKYDLDYCAENIERDTCIGLIEEGGVVPAVGVTHAADGLFARMFPQDAVDEFVENYAFNRAEKARMAQASQVCTSCSTAKARAAFSEEEWKRDGDVRRCIDCNVIACAKCGTPKGPDDYSLVEWRRRVGAECRDCNFRNCSRCGKRRPPKGFSHGQWDAEAALCVDCNKRPCSSFCQKALGPGSYSAEAWDASDALRVCRICVGKKRCGGCRLVMKLKRFSEDQWAAASDDARRCKRCAAPVPAPSSPPPPPRSALDQVPAPLGTSGAQTCSSCKLHLAATAFSTNQRKKGASARCKKCLGN